MTARTASHDEILPPFEPEREYAMEREPEVEPQSDVPREQRGVETPRQGIPMEFFQTHLSILEGDDRRSTIHGMMTALGTKPELERVLQNIAASPIAATADDVANASMDILSR